MFNLSSHLCFLQIRTRTRRGYWVALGSFSTNARSQSFLRKPCFKLFRPTRAIRVNDLGGIREIHKILETPAIVHIGRSDRSIRSTLRVILQIVYLFIETPINCEIPRVGLH